MTSELLTSVTVNSVMQLLGVLRVLTSAKSVKKYKAAVKTAKNKFSQSADYQTVLHSFTGCCAVNLKSGEFSDFGDS